MNVNVSVINIAFYDFCGFRSVAVNSKYKLQILFACISLFAVLLLVFTFIFLQF